MPNQAQHAEHKDKTSSQRGPAKPVRQGPVAPQPAALALQRAIADPAGASPADILALQRTAGNRAVSRLLQAKLTVGPAGDRYEQEADRVAEQVMSGQPSAVPQGGFALSSQTSHVRRQAEEEEEVQTKPLADSITPLVQRQAEEEEEIQTKSLIQRQAEDEEEIQTFPSPGGRGGRGEGEVQRQAEDEEEVQTKSNLQSPISDPQASPDVESRLAAHKGGGSPLPADVRATMEPHFGADFGGVRVHTGGEADHLNRQLSAQAFTHGQDIYMAAGKYAPGTPGGNRLLAHELTHVVQQDREVVRRLVADDPWGELYVPKSWLDTKFDDRSETVREVYENQQGKQTALRTELLANITQLIDTSIVTITEVKPSDELFSMLEQKQRIPNLKQSEQDKWKQGFRDALSKTNEVTVLGDGKNGKIGSKKQKLIISPNELVKATSDLAAKFDVKRACALIAIFKAVDIGDLKKALNITKNLKGDMDYYEALHNYYYTGKKIEYDEPVTHPAIFAEWGFKMIFAGNSSFRSLRLGQDLETGKKYIFDLKDHAVYVTMKKKLQAGAGVGQNEMVKDYFDFHSDRGNNYNLDESVETVEYIYEK